jgi:hypothetical protein
MQAIRAKRCLYVLKERHLNPDIGLELDHRAFTPSVAHV